ncbi:exodeoxyribonuclease VII large subunit [Paraferrimonas haliotis]|uniref:exodeoxyribonuclease VII large subunit n=1 Tax=Paraferrimonas haliotis TaxID=2013866 RepID=UPI000BA999A3|nr:exodeoxyribonuclease VII large subunit [Paraferrimonas haliotis]
MAKERPPLLSVSQLNRQVRQLLEGQIGRIWLTGEISNFAAPASGHWYFSLKDSKAQVRCAMFKGRNQRVSFIPKNGQQVTVQADLSLYEPRGDYQLIVGNMVDSGAGALKQQFDELKAKLAAQGLFSTEHKQALPRPKRLGVITSPSGAAIRDVLHVLERRAPAMEVVIYPAQVQGELAAKQLIHAIERANQRNEVDALLLTRGGGSLEDLWCFNDEQLAHAIFNSALPVVSAVGHEVDVTIADFVADVRAPTPSAGAEMLSGDSLAQLQQLASLGQRLRQSMAALLYSKQQRSQQYRYRLDKHHPSRQLDLLKQQFDETGFRLHTNLSKQLQTRQQHIERLGHRLFQATPAQRVALDLAKTEQLQGRLHNALNTVLNNHTQRWQSLASQLNAISPLATLERGYSISRNAQHTIVTKVDQVTIDEPMSVQVSDGVISATVNQIEKS